MSYFGSECDGMDWMLDSGTPRLALFFELRFHMPERPNSRCFVEARVGALFVWCFAECIFVAYFAVECDGVNSMQDVDVPGFALFS